MDNPKITVDYQKKFIKTVWTGTHDVVTIEKGAKSVDDTLRKFNKGEAYFLSDVTDVDMRFLPPGAAEILNKSQEFLISHAKKVALVVSKLMLEVSLGKVLSGDNFRMFGSEQEAMKWLFE